MAGIDWVEENGEREEGWERYVLANNGWIWNADPLLNFAKEGKSYLRREVIVWGDCVVHFFFFKVFIGVEIELWRVPV